MRGLGDCKFERANEAWGFDGGDAWWTALAATWEKGADWPTDRGRQLHRPQGGNLALGLVHRQLAAAPGGRRAASSARRSPLKPSFCPLSMLFTDWNRSGTPSPARLQRPRILRGRPGADVEDRARQAEPALYTAAEGWKTPAHLGHGHRQLRPRTSTAIRNISSPAWPTTSCRRWPPSRRTARRQSRRLRRRGLRQGRHRAPALYRRRPEAQHGLARAVRGREQ